MNLRDRINQICQKRFGSSAPDDLSDADGWMYWAGNPLDAVLYSSLYMPDFWELKGSVLLKWNLSDSDSRRNFSDAIEKNPSDRQKLEASFNFVEIGYLFSAKNRTSSDEEDEILAQIVQNASQAWLQKCYPDRVFVVNILSPDRTGSTVGLNFYETRK